MHKYRSDQNTRWKASKNGAPPLTAQTPGQNWLIFWRESTHVITLGLTEAIFEFPIWDRDMGPTPSPRMGPSGPKNGQKFFFSIWLFFGRIVFSDVYFVPNNHFLWCFTIFSWKKSSFCVKGLKVRFRDSGIPNFLSFLLTLLICFPSPSGLLKGKKRGQG